MLRATLLAVLFVSVGCGITPVDTTKQLGGDQVRYDLAPGDHDGGGGCGGGNVDIGSEPIDGGDYLGDDFGHLIDLAPWTLDGGDTGKVDLAP